jgi:ribosomal protein S18 acetylase RimI-like enzyme
MNSVRIVPWDGDADVAAEAFTRGFSQSSTPVPETAERIRHQMLVGHADPEASLVAWDGDRPVGALLAAFRSDGRAWVQKMAVAPEYRRAGLGRALSDRFLQHADARGVSAVHAEVLADNKVALALYDSIGFTVARRMSAFAAEIRGMRDDDFLHGDLSLLPPPDDRPARPLHRDRVAMARYPRVDVLLEEETGSFVAWSDTLILDIGGPPDEDSVTRLLTSLPTATYGFVDVPELDPLCPLLKAIGCVVVARHVEVVRPRGGRPLP